MAISVSDLKTAAVLEFFNNGGGSSDFITPTIYGRAINMALQEMWEKCVELNLDMYAFRGRTLSVTSGTQEYALNSDTLRVTAFLIRSGTSPNYSYQGICPFSDSRDHYYLSLQGLYPNYAIVGMSQYQWFESKQALDGSGNWIRYITIEPSPSADFTVVYDGTRYITKITVPPSSESTTYLDVPDNFLRPLALRVLKYCELRDKTVLDNVNREIALADSTAIPVHRRGLNFQVNKRVVRS